MKKVLLFVALIAGTGRLMAQNDLKLPEAQLSPLFQIKVDTTLKSPTLKQLTKMADANTLKNLTTLQNFNQNPLAETKLIDATESYTTPVAVLSGRSNMPVKKIGGIYTMPVAGKDADKKSRATIVNP
ncbi:hypothetical protein [Mucilaginibacter sp.]|uniref:hypothetical protein n=1 Tax=Mucilaginibacter sp. TaxID=1882438 RepID=UPI0032669857